VQCFVFFLAFVFLVAHGHEHRFGVSPRDMRQRDHIRRNTDLGAEHRADMMALPHKPADKPRICVFKNKVEGRQALPEAAGLFRLLHHQASCQERRMLIGR
jgi:hypothetical protein